MRNRGRACHAAEQGTDGIISGRRPQSSSCRRIARTEIVAILRPEQMGKAAPLLKWEMRLADRENKHGAIKRRALKRVSGVRPKVSRGNL